MDKNNININKLCKKCRNKCKQADSVTLITCPKFEKAPKQLEIVFDKEKRVRRKKK